MDKIVEPSNAVEMEQTEDGKVVLRGVVVRCDVPTLTGRVYPRAVVERAIAARQQAVRCGQFMAACPTDTWPMVTTPGDRVYLADVAGIVRKLDLACEVRAEVLLLNSDKGKIISKLVKDGHRIRFFPIGRGSVTEAEGVGVVQDDFEINGVGITVED